MRKATNHRKRHMPPGPCGIWFQSQQQLNKQAAGGGGGSSSTNATGSSSRKRSQHEASLTTTTAAAENAWAPPSSRQHSQSSSPNHHHHHHHRHQQQGKSPSSLAAADMSFSPAWSSMLQELNLITPYLPPSMTKPLERYRQLRPHMPPNFVLLLEIQRGDHDQFGLSSNSSSSSSNAETSLLVLVSTVESHIHHNIWTVELKDETGAAIKAWVEPSLVQQQLQQPLESSIIRPGVVWRLRQFGMVLLERQDDDDDDDHDEEERLERMLLIGGSAIEKVWTPEQQQKNQQEETDTPRRQRQFLDWMERRKALPLIHTPSEESSSASASGSADMEEEDEEEEDGPPDEEKEYDSISRNPRRNGFGGNFEEQMEGSHLPTPTNHPENANDDSEEDEEQFEPRGRHSVGGLWNATSAILPSSRQHSCSLAVSQSQLSSRPATQDFTHNSWSRPRLEEVTEETCLPTTSLNANRGTSNYDGASSTQLTAATSQDIVQLPSLEASKIREPQDTTRSEKPVRSRQEQEVLVEKTQINEENGDAAETQLERRPRRSKSQMSPMATAWKASSQNSSYWNSMLDEDDRSDDDDGNTENRLRQGVERAELSETTERLLSTEPPRESEDSDKDADSDEAGGIGTKSAETTSMFDACNFGNMDLAAFSDDDDDEDD